MLGPIIARPVTKPGAAVQSIPSPILMRTSASSPSPSRTASPYKISASSSSSPSRYDGDIISNERRIITKDGMGVKRAIAGRSARLFYFKAYDENFLLKIEMT